MASPRFASLQQHVTNYQSAFIADKDDLDATNSDHLRAIAFRILASAAIEEFVEEICKAAAQEGINLLKRGEPTTTGYALVTWAVSRETPGVIPVHSDDIRDHFAQYDQILKQYLDSVASTHGVSGRDFRKLVFPVGVRDHQVPNGLLDRLQSLADRRDPVVHTSSSGAQQRLGPSVELKQISDIVVLLERLDEAVKVASQTYPIPRPDASTM